MTEKKEFKELSEAFRDIKDPKDMGKLFDLENPSVIRGKTPEDIDEKCLKLCQDYLAGNWDKQTKDTIQVDRIVGGYVNQMYHVKITEPDPNESVPQEVTIKMDVGVDIGGYDNKFLKDMIVSLAFSEKGLGPKVYGVFDKGIIQSYHKHRCFNRKEQENKAVAEQVFRKLAHIHNLDIPIKRDPNWLFEWFDKSFKKLHKTYDINKEIEEYNCESLKTFNFVEEINWLKEKTKEIESPAVFTHNDYRSSNILITEPNDELVICDFDISCYGYRGQDFSSLMRDYGPGLGPGNQEPVTDFPVEDSIMKPLVDIYINECEKIHGKAFTDDPKNSVEHILKEMKFFYIVRSVVFMVFMLSNDPNDPSNGFPMPRKMILPMANFGLRNYLILKRIMIEKNMVTP